MAREYEAVNYYRRGAAALTPVAALAATSSPESRIVAPPTARWGGLPISVSAEGGTDS